ncbi:MAG TPA: murein biosynthesis integral membrane protein MurJ [Lapillicoccus sp.]|nr:murein biosynthesis integral membrane protein MurJ [Lapillicoccus sp.]
MTTTTPSLTRSSLTLAAGTMASRVLGVVRQSLIVLALGQGLVGNAFQTANNLPNVIYMLIAGGVINSVLVPQIVKAMRLPDGGREYTDRIITLSTTGMAIITAACTAGAGLFIYLYAGNLAPDAAALATFFAVLTMPQIFFYGLYAVLGQILNARSQFGAFAWAPAVANVFAIGGLLAFMRLYDGHVSPGEWTAPMVWLFAGSATLSIVAQAVVLMVALWRTGFRWTPRFGIRGVGLRTTSKVAGWAFVALVVAQLSYLVASNVIWHASKQPSTDFVAGISVYATAFFIFMVPHGFVTLSVITAIYPRLSRAVHDGDLDLLRTEYRRGLALPTVLTIPASFALVIFALPVVTLLFSSRDPREIPATALVLTVMAPGIVPFGIDVLNQRFFYAHDDGRMVFYEQVVLSVVASGIALLALAFRPEVTVAVVSVGLVLSNVCSALFGMWFVRRRVGYFGFGEVAFSWVRMVAACMVASAFSYLATTPLREGHSGRSWAFAELAVGGLVFAIVYFGLALLMRVPEVGEMLAPVVRRLPGGRPRGRHARG